MIYVQLLHLHRCFTFIDVTVVDIFPLQGKINHSIYSIANCLFFAILKHTKSSSFLLARTFIPINTAACIYW